MANSLSIKVKVDLPTAGTIKKQVDNAFKNMGDINANVKVNPKLNAKSIAGIKSKLKQALSTGDGIKVNFTANTKSLSQIQSKLREIRNLAKEPIKLNVDTGLGKIDQQLESAQKKVSQNTSNSIKSLAAKQKKEMMQAQREVEKLNEQMMKERTNAIKQPDYSNVHQKYEAEYKEQLRQAKSRFAQLAKQNGLSQGEINNILGTISSNPKLRLNLDMANQKRAITEATAEWKKYRAAVNEAHREQLKLDKGNVGQHETQVIRDHIAALNQEATAISKNFNAKQRAQADDLRRENNYQRSLVKAQRKDGRISSGNGIRKTGITANMDVFYMLQQGVGMAAGVVSALNDVDREITKVTKVVPDSQKAVNNWKKNIFKDAKSVGKTAPEFASAVEQWATAGYNLKQSVGLAKTSVMGSFVGEVPVEDMVRYMAVPLKAFRKEGLKDKDVINAMNEVSNKHAIEMNDLGSAYQKASSTVGATGTKFSQLTGIITAAQEGTRAGGDMIGTAFKTIGSRLAKMGTGLTKQDKVRAKFFKDLNVDLTDSNGNLKSTWEIMDQLGDKWDSMSKKDKNTAAQYAAGANHANIFQATMDNWKVARKSAMEAQGQVDLVDKNHGSAYQEFDKQKQSIQFKLVQLQNTWTEFLQNFSGGREGIGQILNMLNSLGSAMSKVFENKGVASAARWTLITTGAIMARRAVNALVKSMANIGKQKLGQSRMFDGDIKQADRLRDKLRELQDAWSDLRGKEKDGSKLKELDSDGKKVKPSESANGNGVGGGTTIYNNENVNNGNHRRKGSNRRRDKRRHKTNVDDVKQATADMNNMSNTINRAATNTSNLGKQTTKSAGAAAKLGKAWNVAKATFGVVGSVMGGVGLALDGITIGMGVLSAMGVDPIKMMDKAFHPAKYAAQAFNNEIGKTVASIEKTNTAIDNNGIVSGKLKKNLQTVKDLQTEVQSAGTDGNGNINDGSFKDIKKKYNALAKANGLELRIGDDKNAQVIQQKMAAMNGAMKQVKVEDAQKLGNSVRKQIRNVNKALKADNISKLLSTNSDAAKEISKIKDKYRNYSGNGLAMGTKGDFSKDKRYKNLEDKFRFGQNAASIWNSHAGKQIQDAVNKAQAGVRKAMSSMGDALADGTISKSQLMNMGRQERELATLGSLKKLNSLHGADDGGKAEGALRAALQSLDIVDKKKQDRIVSHAKNDEKGKMISDLKSAGVEKQLIAAMAGIGAVYQQQFAKAKGGFLGQASRDQTTLDKYVKTQKGLKGANAQYLVDPNTGFLNYNKIAKFNMGAVTTKRGKQQLNAAGVKFGSHMGVGQLLKLTQGLDGDPTKILNDIAKGNGKASTSTAIAVANNARKRWDEKKQEYTGGASSQELTSFAARNAGINGQKQMSKKAYDAAVQQALTEGNINQKQAQAMINQRDKNYTKNGYARTYSAAKSQIGNQKLTSESFKKVAKDLNHKDRKDLANALKHSGQLDSSAYKDLQKFLKGGSKGKGTKPKDKNDKGDGKGKGNSKRKSKKNDDDDSGSKSKKKKRQDTVDKITGTKRAKADSKQIRTAAQMMKQLSGKGKGSISAKQLRNLQSRMKSKKEQDKLAQQLAKSGKLSSGAKKYASKHNKVNLSKSRKQGEQEERAKQKGRDKVKKSSSSKEKSSNRKKVKAAETQGKKEAAAKAKASSKHMATNTKKKVGSSTSKKSSSSNSALKKLQSSLKGMKSNKIKVSVSGNASSKIKKIKSDLKGIKNKKVKITASGNAASKAKQTKSALKGIKNKKIRITVSGNATGKVRQIKSALNGIKSKKVSIRVSASGTGKVNALKSAISGISSKSVSVRAKVSGTGKVRALRSAINGVHSKSVTVSAKVSGLGEVQALSAAIAAVHSKSVTVTATKVEKGKSITSDSVAIGDASNPLKSMSIVAGDPALALALSGGASNMGVDANSAMNGQSVTDYSDSTQNVSEDYWRYMDKQLYTGLPLDEQVNKLEGAVTQADEDMDKLINLSRQRIDLDNRQIAYQRSMQGAYQQQITDTINELKKYGFQNNGNTITNLGHARDIHGDNAGKVDELLGKYQSAYQNFSEATQKIQELQTDIWQQSKNQQDYNNTKDQKMVEQFQRDLEIVNTAIDNQKNILERESDSLSDGDYRMKLKNSSDQIDAKQNAVQQLLAEFNRLSVANFVGTKEADNAKNLLESLQSIRDSITENLDSIDELKKTMRDTQLSSIIEGLDKYTNNLNDSIDRLKNNVSNLEDGLLSGTTYGDLMSSNFDVVNLNQQAAYTKSVNDRIALEKDLDSALDQFARKNVDRTAQVANQQLQVEAQKYNQMLAMATEYSRGFRANPTEIQSEYRVSVATDKLEVGDATRNQEYLNASLEYQKEMNDLKADYNEKMSKANTAEEKQVLNQAMVYEQLAMQVKVYRSMIDADEKAIQELRDQAKNPDMTTEQLKTITDQITEYEKNVMDAQNNIKDAIKGRFEYEKQLMDKQMDDYKRLSDTIGNLVTIADALHLDGETQAAIINQQYASTYREYDNYLNVLARLREELSNYEKGSFEYNQLSSMIDDYQSTLNSTVTSLLDITKNSFDQTLNSIQDSFEKSVNDGMTANQAKFDQDVWYNPMQKELKLEEMRLKITELEDKTVEKRIAALDAQERMSRAEADYVDKQLDLALAQQKLNNTINKKDVRYLEKDENGKFNWTYIADQEQVDAARQEVNQAKQALEDAKVSNRNDYIQKVEEVISGAKDGSLNQEEVRKRLEQLNNSYKFILKDIPTFDITKVEDILKAYDEYEKKNADILKEYQRNSAVAKTDGYQEIVKGFGDQFKAVSKDLGEIFGKQLREALNLPNGIRNAYGTGKDNSLTVNGDINLELPDVKDANEFAEALKNLPQLAHQYVTKKH